MSWRASSRGDRGKAPVYTTSHGDDSSDETTLAGERAARVLQSHFDRGDNDTRPTDKIPMETRFRRRCLAKAISVSFESCTISSGVFTAQAGYRDKGL